MLKYQVEEYLYQKSLQGTSPVFASLTKYHAVLMLNYTLKTIQLKYQAMRYIVVTLIIAIILALVVNTLIAFSISLI